MPHYLLRMQHTSLQFSDNRRQQEKDVQSLFAKGIAHHVKTGTEAGPSPVDKNANRFLLRFYAKEYNHAIHFAGDNWIAINRDIIQPDTLVRSSVFVMDNQRTAGSGFDRIMPTLQFDHVNPRVGGLAFGAIHYNTKGRKKGDPNFWVNREYAQQIDTWMKRVHRGGDIPFVSGDFNMSDKKSDWAFGHDWTSMGDELKRHLKTGHGDIDGFASYDKSKRVRARGFQVLRDNRMFMHTDHFVCRGVWEIGLLPANRKV